MGRGRQEEMKVKAKYSAIPTRQFSDVVSYACRAAAFWESHQAEIIAKPAYQEEMSRYFRNLMEKLNDVEEVKTVVLEVPL